MSTIIDINVTKIEPIVTITAEPNEYIVNINTVQGGGDFLPLAGGTMDEGADIFFDNGSKLSEGAYDEGTGGNGGIARTCAVGYEDKWEAGEQYITETGSGIIQFRRFAFNVPTVDDDTTKRYAVGSYWQMRNNDIYICQDATEGDAIWELVNTGTIPTLDQVATQGNVIIGKEFVVRNSDDTNGIVYEPVSGILFITTNGATGIISNSQLNLHDDVGNFELYFSGETRMTINRLTFLASNLTQNVEVTFRDGVSGDVAFVDDITTPTLQEVLDNNHDLADGNFFAGTDAGDSNTGVSIIAVGESAGNGNSGDNGIFLGNIAGLINTGISVNALGNSAGVSNTFNNVNLFGESAQADEDGQTVLSKDGTIMARISTTELTASRKYTLQDGDGTLAFLSDITGGGGGGASISFYLNGSVSQGTIGGISFREMDRTPILGTGTNFNINTNGYIQSFITDAGVPNLLEIPAGNWNFETYFSASSGGGTPSFYIELYKWDGVTLSLIASNSANPEGITNGTVTDLYVSALAVPQTTLLATDRLAVRIWVNNSGRTITLHTEDNNLCQVITTFSTGLTALNGLTAQVQNLAVGTSGTDFAINSTTSTHTFNLPTASASNRGALSSTDWSTFNNKQNNLKTFNTTQGIYYFEEFLGQSRHVDFGIGNSQGSSAYTASITNRTNQQGVVQHTTNASSTGQAGFTFVNGAFQFIGGGVITLEEYVNITTLSTLAERFYTFFGYVVGSNFTNILNNIVIVYDEGGVYLSANASPNFKCITRAGSTATTTVTSIPVVAGQWNKLRIVINATASSVEFYIDNVLVATHNTNIPLTTTAMYVANGISKATGTAARSMQTDYFMYEQIFTNPR